jgi:hypothetical protein
MRFDVVIGNPPYQDSTAKSSKKAWDKFLEKSIQICKKNGFVAFITPFSWATPSNKSFDIFKNHDVKIIDLNGKKYFPNIGTTISWYIIQNCNNKQSTKIISEDEKIEINLQDVDFLPSILSKQSISILSKILSNSFRDSMGVMFDSFCHSQRVDRIVEIQDNQHPFPVKHTATSTIWSNIKHPNTKIKKVMFPISSSMKAEYDGQGDFGCSQHYAWIEVGSKEEAENLIYFLNSKIITFIRKSTQWTASWSKPILKKMPKVPLNIKWTNKMLYDFFKLNKEEKEYIEKIVK